MMQPLEKEETRDRYGETLVRLAGAHKDVVAMDCDLGRSTRSHRITEVDPGRFVELGIAEQDMISTAAGMARMGKTVFVNSFAVFVTGRAFDQVRQQVCLPKANVKICGSSAGLTLGADGATHQSVLDVALMRCLPNMTVLVPADGHQTAQAVEAAYHTPGPVYLRLSRYPVPPVIPADAPFEVGKCLPLRQGGLVALASCGPVLHHVLAAAELLEERGLQPGIFNFHTLKPFDQAAVRQIARDYSHVVTVEEHSIHGGLGTAVAEALAEAGAGAVLLRLGVRDTFGESGLAEELLARHGLDSPGIAAGVLDFVKPRK